MQQIPFFAFFLFVGTAAATLRGTPGGKTVQTYDLDANATLTNPIFTGDSKKMFVMTDEGQVNAFNVHADARSQKPRWKYDSGGRPVGNDLMALMHSSGGNDLIVSTVQASDDLSFDVTALNITDGSRAWNFRVTGTTVTRLVTSPHVPDFVFCLTWQAGDTWADGITVVHALDADGALKWKLLLEHPNMDAPTSGIAFSDDGSYLFVVTSKSAHAIGPDLSQAPDLQWITTPSDTIPAPIGTQVVDPKVLAAGGGHALVTAGGDGDGGSGPNTVFAFNTQAGTQDWGTFSTGNADDLWPKTPTLSPDGSTLYFAVAAEHTHLYAIAGLQGTAPFTEKWSLKFDGSPILVDQPVVSPDGKVVLWSSAYAGLHAVSQDGTPLWVVNARVEVLHASNSVVYGIAIDGSSGQNVRQYTALDLATGSQLWFTEMPTGPNEEYVVSPDGSLFVVKVPNGIAALATAWQH
jgi:outer membrane protein assembly factor BamB